MSKYQDENGMWHDRHDRKSNNVFIYGAYAKALGLDVSRYPDYYSRCKINADRNNILINRHPGQNEPPLSHDEALGLIYLRLLDYDAIKGNHFVYHGRGERLSSKIFEKLVAAMVELTLPRVVVRGFSVTIKRAKLHDRNRWWEDNLKNVAYFATRFNPAYTYVIKKFHNRSYHVEEEKLWAFFRDCETKNKANSHGEYSRKNILWLLHIMNGDEKRAKSLKPWVNFERYFGVDHDFTKAIKRKYGV